MPNQPKSTPAATSSARSNTGITTATSARYSSARKSQFPPSPASLPPAVSKESNNSYQSGKSSVDQKTISDS